MIKTRDIVVECYFENGEILEALNKAGFRKVMVVNENLEPLENTEYADRIHIVAMKK